MRKKISYISAIGAAIILFCGIGIGVFGLGILSQEKSSTETNQNAEKLFQKANDLIKQTNYQEAIIEYEKVVVMLPESEIAQDAQYWIGQSHFRMEKFDEAISIFRNLIENYPESAVIPVTKLMIARVRQAKENKEFSTRMDATADNRTIIDPESGAEYKKIEILRGNKDVFAYSVVNISPNGKFLLQDNIVIPLEDGEPFELIDTWACRSVWSPDGKKVAYYSGTAICVIPVSPETGKPVGPTKKLLDGRYRFNAPVSWSPDSDRIVFEKLDQKNEGDIWTLSVKDGTLIQLTDDPMVEMSPTWSPDGKKIAYNFGDSEIRIVSSEGGEPRKLADIHHSGGGSSIWSPDGKWLFFQAQRELFLLRLADEHIFKMAPPENVGEFFSWSSDGEKMLFFYDSYDSFNILKVVSTSGGPSVQLGREISLDPIFQFWSPDSRVIVMNERKSGVDDSGF